MQFGDKGMDTLFAHTYDGCLLPLLAAILVFGAESALSCQQEGPIFLVQPNTDQENLIAP